MWDLISIGPRPQRENLGLWSKEVKEDRMAVGIVQKIIREGVSNQIAFNSMDLKDPKEMWDKLKSICIEVGQGVVYSILQKLLHYPKITKPKGYEKPVMQIFAEIKHLYKRLRLAMTPGQDLWDTITIVIALDSLHEDFDTTTTSLLEIGDKTIDQIQSILQLKEAKNLSKRATGGTGNLAITFKDKNGPKRKANNNNECYNCHKFGHFRRDYSLPNKKLNRNTQQSRREESRRGNSRRRHQSGGQNDSRAKSNRAHQALENKSKHEDNSDPEPFALGTIGTANMVNEQRGLQRTSRSSFSWFLDSCTSRHLYNDRRLFTNIRAKSIDFITAAGQIIQTEEIGTVSIPLVDGITTELQNVALAPECDSNLISLGQLWESGITYHDDLSLMTLMRGGRTIAHTKKSNNLFTLDLAMPGQIMSAISRVMAITSQGQPTHLVSKNKCIRL